MSDRKQQSAVLLRARITAALSGRYLVEDEIGAGGMATVYLAQDLEQDRPVAIKVLKPDLAVELGAERFLLEIKTTANLHHPNILSLYASGEADGLLYYVMPYVQGESLRDRLTRDQQLPLDDALHITREVASALGYAHAQGVIHRDIKPANILLHDGHAIVADFGITRAISYAGPNRITQSGVTVGTPTYMSPEQASGEIEIDGRSDIYALGIVLFEMLAGQPPFAGANAATLVRQHITVEPVPITNLRRSLPATVVAAVHRALAKAPSDRFGTGEEFAAALAPGADMIPPSRPAVRPEPVAAEPPTVRRRIVLFAGLALLLIAIVVGWLLLS